MAARTTPAARARSGRIAGLAMAVLALPALLLSLDMSVLYLAVPALSKGLGASNIEQLWITDIYPFMTAGFLVTMGTLADKIGRRRLLLAGGAGFAVSTLLAAYSSSPAMLIASRALMGIFGAALIPAALALLGNLFEDPQRRRLAMAVWVSCFMAGSALGPLLGGVLLAHFWWGSVFLVGVPVMVLLLAAGPVLLPEYRDENAGKIDVLSVALSLAAILPATYGIKEFALGAGSVLPAVGIVVGVIFGVLFVLRQRTLDSPLLDLRLFGNSAFTGALVGLLVSSAILSGVSLLAYQHLQMVEGLAPLRAGLWLLPSSVAMALASLASPGLARLTRPAYLIAGGLILTGIGGVLLTQVTSSSGPLMLIVALVVTGIGASPITALGADLVVAAVRPEKAGSAASLALTSANLGIAGGVAVLGSIGTAVYSSRLRLPEGIPAATAHAARLSIAGGVAAAQKLPARLGAELIGSARGAFTDGLHVAATVGAALAVAVAVFAFVALRHLKTEGGPAPAPAESADRPAFEAEENDDRYSSAGPAKSR